MFIKGALEFVVVPMDGTNEFVYLAIDNAIITGPNDDTGYSFVHQLDHLLGRYRDWECHGHPVR